MFGRFMPREGRFFDHFNAHAEQVVLAARELVALVSDMDNAATHIDAIEAIENRADKINHDAMALLHQTFVTPFDRDAIHALVTDLDDIVDSIRDISEAMSLYNIRRVTPDVLQLAELSLSCCERLKRAVSLIENKENATDILSTCREVDQLEADCDRVFRSALSRIFRDERDAVQIIKMKAIYEGLEKITDYCQDASKVIEGIVLENS